MTELKCTRCGMVRSHADASIEDMNKTCEKSKNHEIINPKPEEQPVRTGTVSVGHNWMEINAE